MKFSEYRNYDATGLAGLVKSRDVAPEELLDAALSRAREVNPKLNAIVRLCEATAREAIRNGLPEGPFEGVPFLLKDVTTQLAGTPTSAGSRLLKDVVAIDDSALVADYKRAGFVIFGKTNTPEFGLLGVTEPDLWGATLNPWDAGITCGGSSGGAAVAVASGVVPAAQASDAGGSIRIPASCCGLFGFKPSRGRVSMAPSGEGWGGLTVLHALTRSVRDSAAILDASCLPKRGDPYRREPPAVRFADDVLRPPPSLRIGMLTTNVYGAKLDGPCEAAVHNAAALCKKLGHRVEEIAAPEAVEPLVASVTVVAATSLAATVDRELARRGRALGESELEAVTHMMYERGKSISAVEYANAIHTLHKMTRELAAWSSGVDVVLLSTLGTLPLPVGMLKRGLDDLSAISERLYKFGPNTQLFNVTGQPAMSLPLWWDGAIPVGVQFAAPAGDEATLFRLAGQLEEAAPWFGRTPPEATAA